jgi:hypothetical protein
VQISRTGSYVWDYDLLDFEVTGGPGFDLPSSFGGASGGALWRFYYVMKDNVPTVVDRRLIGVLFYQSLSSEGKRVISCHGPTSVYSAVPAAISKRWPEQE